MARVGVVGGTGPHGIGMALRLVIAGEEVVIGSRSLERAETAVRRIRERILPRVPPDRVRAADNATAARTCDVVVLAVPYTALPALLDELRPSLAGKVVIDVVNPLIADDGLFRVAPVAEGSASGWIQAHAPEARVVGCFKNLSAHDLWRIDRAMHGDVLVCSDFPEAIGYVSSLIELMPLLRAVDAGPLANAAHVEHITALLLNLNRRYRAQSSIQIVGL